MEVRHSRWVILIRLLVGWVFVAEGILKFTRPETLGAARFEKIGFPSSLALAQFVGVLEIVCGTLIVLGLFVRLASVPLLIDIVVAILSTKVPILLGHGFWLFADPTTKPFGIGTALHEARTDFSMLLGLVFLILSGGGVWSLDYVRRRG
jgi:putative oxidoreductase